jgi:hypothetical protein
MNFLMAHKLFLLFIRVNLLHPFFSVFVFTTEEN